MSNINLFSNIFYTVLTVAWVAILIMEPSVTITIITSVWLFCSGMMWGIYFAELKGADE